MVDTGVNNGITDVPGVRVGHAERAGAGWCTGATVVHFPGTAIGAVDQRGGAPGTRETDLLEPENLVGSINAICLAGGSAYGLAAADGVMRRLAEQHQGLAVGQQPHEVVPIVPAAVLFDLPWGEWGNTPDASFGYDACAAATSGPVVCGSVGAGTGATVGSLQGGIGTASELVAGTTVGALAAVNASGEAVRFDTGEPFAADHELAAEFGGGAWPGRRGQVPTAATTTLNTTVGVVAVSAELTKAECRRLAVSAQDGIARAVRPAHSMFDGDTVFAAATGGDALPGAGRPFGDATRVAAVDALCAAAARVFARAMVQGMLTASGGVALPAYREVWPEAVADDVTDESSE